MAKKNQDYAKLKHSAYELVVQQGKTQKDAAALLKVSEKTMSDWAVEGNWRDMRKTRQSAAGTARENILQIISLLSEKRLDLEYEINEAAASGDKESELEKRAEASRISNDLAYHNKALAELNKGSTATLGVLVDVFDDIFSALREYDPKLFDRTIDFQTQYLRRKSNELG